MQTLIVHTTSKHQTEDLKKFLDARHIKYESGTDNYTPEFNAKMKEGEDDIAAGRTIKMAPSDLWK